MKNIRKWLAVCLIAITMVFSNILTVNAGVYISGTNFTQTSLTNSQFNILGGSIGNNKEHIRNGGETSTNSFVNLNLFGTQLVSLSENIETEEEYDEEMIVYEEEIVEDYIEQITEEEYEEIVEVDEINTEKETEQIDYLALIEENPTEEDNVIFLDGRFKGEIIGHYDGGLYGTFEGTIDGEEHSGQILGPFYSFFNGDFEGTIIGYLDGTLFGTWGETENPQPLQLSAASNPQTNDNYSFNSLALSLAGLIVSAVTSAVILASIRKAKA